MNKIGKCLKFGVFSTYNRFSLGLEFDKESFYINFIHWHIGICSFDLYKEQE